MKTNCDIKIANHIAGGYKIVTLIKWNLSAYSSLPIG